MITVDSWGIAGSVVGPGMLGRAWLGQGRGGAVDVAAAALANRLVGNPATARCIESSGGVVVSFDQPAMVAITGAGVQVDVDGGPPVGWGSPVVLPAGSTLRIRRVVDGVRAYIAVRGGLTGTGDLLEAGADPGVPAATHPAAPAPRSFTAAIWPGPRLDSTDGDHWQTLLRTGFMVVDTSRVGVRLEASSNLLQRHELRPSEGMVEGAVQLPPDGNPIVMLADHPVTGGYPVIAVVDPDSIATVAQIAVGEELRFSTAR